MLLLFLQRKRYQGRPCAIIVRFSNQDFICFVQLEAYNFYKHPLGDYALIREVYARYFPGENMAQPEESAVPPPFKDEIA